jgi:hypothetical protein
MFYHSTYLALPTYINILDNVEREEMILQKPDFAGSGFFSPIICMCRA